MINNNDVTVKSPDPLIRAAEHWSIRRKDDGSRWWMHPLIHGHINQIVCGEPIDGPHAGFSRLIEKAAPAGGFRRAISVGCGSGGKEMRLILSGMVQHFDLYEIGEHRRDIIYAKAAEFGVADRIQVHIGDVFAKPMITTYDLVYWNNALHHMQSAQKAVEWSFEILKCGGLLAADDFVGPSRFQWTDDELELSERVRCLLPERFLTGSGRASASISRAVQRPTIEHMLLTDPTEAADSDRIIDAVRTVFMKPNIIPTGGVIYHLALNDVLSNFNLNCANDVALLRCLLLLDQVLARQGKTHYAVMLATKP